MPGLRTAPGEPGFKPPSGGVVASPAIHRGAQPAGRKEKRKIMTTLDPAPPPTQSDQTASDLTWPQALTLSERIAALRHGRLCPPEGADPPKVERRIARWREQAPFKDDRWWAERLATDDLDEAELRAVLAASAQGTTSEETPSWWRDLEEACAFPVERETTEPGGDLDELAGFFAAVEPILVWKLADVRRRIAELAAAPGPLPFDPATVHRLLLQSLPDRMAGAVSRTLALELNVARLEGHLAGETAAERFQSFVDGLTRPGGMAAIFAEYPVLGR